MLGSGNFGKVCLATVSHEQIRDVTQLGKEMELFESNSNQTTSPIHRRISFKRGQNSYNVTKAKNDTELNTEQSVPLIAKGSRLVAVKMVKG